MGSRREYNQFQLFVLAFLTTEEQRQKENKEAYGRPNPNNLPLKFRYPTTITELSKKVPPSYIPGLGSGQEMLNDVIQLISELKQDGLLAVDTDFRHNEPENEVFYITAGGMLYIRRHYQGLMTLIGNKQEYEKLIDNLQSDSGNKKYLKALRNKLLEKSEDAIISTVLSEAVQGGFIILRFLVQLLMRQNGN